MRLVSVVLTIIVFSSFAFGQLNPRRPIKKLPSSIEFITNSGELKIIEKPRAVYPSQEDGTFCAQGTVLLRVTFQSDGTIGSVLVVKGLPFATNRAIEAALRIKFEPATKVGQPVTVSKLIGYSFGIY